MKSFNKKEYNKLLDMKVVLADLILSYNYVLRRFLTIA